MLIFCDSGDHTNSQVGSGKYSGARNGDFNPFSFAGSGRFGTNPLFWGWDARYVYRDLGANYGAGSVDVIVGMAMNFGSANGGSEEQLVGFHDGATNQLGLYYLYGSNVFRVRRNGTQVGSDIAYVFEAVNYHYVEFRARFHDTTGQYEVRVDDVVLANVSGVDTKATANDYMNRLFLGSLNDNYFDVYYDDLYLLDGSGSAPTNTFLGDVRVECRMPNGNGTTSNFDGSDGNAVDNYALVDETPHNADTDYVQSPDVGDKDTYAYQNLTPTAGTVYGVQVMPMAKKTDAGGRSICTVARLSGTEVDGPNVALLGGYTYTLNMRESKPGGGVWTIADVNNAEFGMKVTV